MLEQVRKVRFLRITHARKAVEIAVGQEHAARPALFAVDLKIGEHLLKGDLKRIADVVKQRSQPPEFEEEGRGAMLVLTGREPVESLKGLSEMLVRFVDRKS